MSYGLRVGWGLLLTSFGLGLRHGIDWDHIAAIADLSGTATSRRSGLVLSFLYAVGHAAVVFALGALAIAFGATLPEGVDTWMARVVGVTLVGLGVWVLVELARHGREFRLRSRWMLILDGTFAGLRRVSARNGQRRVSMEHEHDHSHGTEIHAEPLAHDHSHAAQAAEAPVHATASRRSRWSSALGRGRSHSHSHKHDLALPTTASRYGTGTAAGIGMLHGVGVESPTQIAVFVASTSIAGTGTGLLLLIAWVAGLIVANSVLAVLAAFGLLHAQRNFGIYATIAVVVALASIIIGAAFVGGFDVLADIDL